MEKKFSGLIQKKTIKTIKNKKLLRKFQPHFASFTKKIQPEHKKRFFLYKKNVWSVINNKEFPFPYSNWLWVPSFYHKHITHKKFQIQW